MKKILFIATIDGFFKAFYSDHFQDLTNKGWIIDVASSGQSEFKNVRNKYNVNISRSPFKLGNFKVIKQLKAIIDDNDYDIIHCHTPMGGIVARLASVDARRKGTKLIYTAHGFHFYKGAPLLNWLLYYPIEKRLAKKTDLIITINSEDYTRARKKFKKAKIKYIKGVGINPYKFQNSSMIELHKEFPNIENPFILTFVGELSSRKNQIFLIRSFRDIILKYPDITLALVGTGKDKKKLQKSILRYNLNNNVKLLGYRTDIPSIFNETNLVVSSSRQEGLPINTLEGMISGRIMLVTDIRGHEDLIDDGINGFLYGLNKKNEFINKVFFIYENYKKLEEITIKAKEKASNYLVSDLSVQLEDIYKNL